MYRTALKNESPLSTFHELSQQMKEAATSGPRVSNRWCIRQTIAKSWAGMATSLAVRPGQQREAAYAATRAAALAPWLLVHGTLVPIIVRGAFRRRIESAHS
jgi:hypothetical protein